MYLHSDIYTPAQLNALHISPRRLQVIDIDDAVNYRPNLGKFHDIIYLLFGDNCKLNTDYQSLISSNAPIEVQNFVFNYLCQYVPSLTGSDDDNIVFDSIIPRYCTRQELNQYVDYLSSLISTSNEQQAN